MTAAGALLLLCSWVDTATPDSVICLQPSYLHRLGVEFVKRPNDGKMKGLAFIKGERAAATLSTAVSYQQRACMIMIVAGRG